VVALSALVGVHPNAQYGLLFLLVDDDAIGKFIVGNELFDAFFVKNIATLTLFLC
jgi:hypothetical protein